MLSRNWRAVVAKPWPVCRPSASAALVAALWLSVNSAMNSKLFCLISAAAAGCVGSKATPIVGRMGRSWSTRPAISAEPTSWKIRGTRWRRADVGLDLVQGALDIAVLELVGDLGHHGVGGGAAHELVERGAHGRFLTRGEAIEPLRLGLDRLGEQARWCGL